MSAAYQARPNIPPRPNLQRAVSSRLAYPRLSTCDVGFYSGPPLTALSMPPLPSITPQTDVITFNLESSALRTLNQVRSGWAEEASARTARIEAREKAEQERLEKEAELQAAANAAREAAELIRLAAEAAKAEAEERQRQQAREDEERYRLEAQALKDEENAIAARKQELARKQAERLAALTPSPAASSMNSQPSSSSSNHTQSQRAAFETSFSELTGISNRAQVTLLLAALNYDLDRAIAIFFSEDPPTMQAAMEKAKSIQQSHSQPAHSAVNPSSYGSGSSSSSSPSSFGSVYTPSTNHNIVHNPPSSSQPPSYMPVAQHPKVVNIPTGAFSYAQQQPPPSQTTRINVLLPDGSPLIVDCSATDTFWSLYERLSQPLSSRPQWANKSIAFALTTYPHTRFDEQKFNISMREAGLVPSGTLRIELSK